LVDANGLILHAIVGTVGMGQHEHHPWHVAKPDIQPGDGGQLHATSRRLQWFFTQTTYLSLWGAKPEILHYG
jgi:hypothetical protein